MGCRPENERFRATAGLFRRQLASLFLWRYGRTTDRAWGISKRVWRGGRFVVKRLEIREVPPSANGLGSWQPRGVFFISLSAHVALASLTDDGTVYVWDLGARECVHTFVDEGCVRSTSLAVAGNGTRFACGSDAGIVNIYDESCLTEHNPTPIKVIKNLTTAVDTLVFNPDSQILAAASRFKKQATKMVHVGSNTVFGNWPTAASPLSYVQTVAFSPGSGYVTVGNDKGKALLYRLNHYNAV
eukprot:m.290198 g.290198  ORF g.290198 m.290198 type:complete len:243 (+) comp19464_c0_seq2:1145-1873(+)